MSAPIRYRVIGMDCAKDAAEIESAARDVGGVETVKVSTATQIMALGVPEEAVELRLALRRPDGTVSCQSLLLEPMCSRHHPSPWVVASPRARQSLAPRARQRRARSSPSASGASSRCRPRARASL